MVMGRQHGPSFSTNVKAIGTPESAEGPGTCGGMRFLRQIYGSKLFERKAAPACRPVAGETAMRAGTTRRLSMHQETLLGKVSNRNLITTQQTQSLRDHLQSRLRYLIEGSEDLGIRLVSLLRHDQVREFGGETHIRLFDRAPRDGAITALAGLSDNGST